MSDVVQQTPYEPDTDICKQCKNAYNIGTNTDIFKQCKNAYNIGTTNSIIIINHVPFQLHHFMDEYIMKVQQNKYKITFSDMTSI